MKQLHRGTYEEAGIANTSRRLELDAPQLSFYSWSTTVCRIEGCMRDTEAPGSVIVTPPFNTYQSVLLWFRLFLLLICFVVLTFIILIFCFDLCSVGLLLILKVLLYLKNTAILLDHVSIAAQIRMNQTHYLRSLPLVLRLCDQIDLCPSPLRVSCAAAFLQQECGWSIARPATRRKDCARDTCCGLHIYVLQQLAKPRDNI